MFIVRIKYEGKARKLSEPIKTVEELRKRIGELFGSQAASLHILYKDCDKELVSIVDNEDLSNCYDEANDLGESSVTLLVQARIKGSRSASSKKSSSSSSFNSVSFDSDEEDVNAAKNAESQKKLIEQAEAAKKQIQAEFEAKLAEVNAQAQAAKATVAVEKECARSRSGKHCGEKRHPCGEKKEPCGDKGRPFKFLRKLGFMKRLAEQKGQADPTAEFGGFFQQMKDKCPGLMITPSIFREVMSKSLPQIVNILGESYQQTLAANPALKQEIETARAEFQKVKEAGPWGRRHNREESQEGEGVRGHHGRWGHHGYRHHGHHHRHAEESQSPQMPPFLGQQLATPVEAAKTATIVESTAAPVDEKKLSKQEREAIKAEKLIAKAEREKVKAAKEAEKKRILEEKTAQKEKMRLEKEAEKEKRALQKESEKNLLKGTVQQLRKEFPRMNKDEIIALAKENFQTLNYDQLKTHIQNYRVAKSTLK